MRQAGLYTPLCLGFHQSLDVGYPTGALLWGTALEGNGSWGLCADSPPRSWATALL